MEPDVAGFEEAQGRLRSKIGLSVTFYTPIAGTYPPGTRIDPQSQRPMNPLVSGTGSGWVGASAQARVVERQAPGGDPEVEHTAIGILSTDSIGLIVGSGDFDRFASAATEFEARGERYVIRDTKERGLRGRARVVVIGQRKR